MSQPPDLPDFSEDADLNNATFDNTGLDDLDLDDAGPDDAGPDGAGLDDTDLDDTDLDDDAPWISDDLVPDVIGPSESPSQPASSTRLPAFPPPFIKGSTTTDNTSGSVDKTGSETGSKPGLKTSSKTGPSQKHSAELFPIPPEPLPSPVAPAPEATVDSMASSATIGPLPLVETAFLASASSLMWLINLYFPPGPLLRILFPLPIALVYLRWNARAAWMAATVSALLLTILIGPNRSVLFLMPYGFLGVQLGCLWRRKAPWELSILTGGLLVAAGSFFRIWLLSLLAGEDFWGYLIAQITQLIDWGVRVLTNWGWIGLGTWGQPGMGTIAIAAIAMVIFASVVYLFTVHLAAWLVLERLGIVMPEPPGWVQALIEEE
ncbi:MAG: DUF2232 domain-containing protein [Cyanobacteria bacterium J06643_4]